jgi:2-methylcitrate dehydratase PrpD
LGVAGSASGGLLAFLEDGSWTKRFHAGWAATAGIVAAELGTLGFSGPQSVIDGRYGVVASFGAMDQMGPQQFEHVLSDVPEPSQWAVQTSAFKMFACCGYLHSVLTALFDLLDQAPDLKASDIEHVEVGLFKAAFQIVVEPEEVKRAPRNAVDSQFSLFHAVAAAIVDRAAGVGQFDDAAAARADLNAVRQRVTVVHDADIERHFPEKYGARVTLTLRDGKQLQGQCLDPFGSRIRPPGGQDLDAKFMLGAGLRFGDAEGASEVLSTLRRLEEMDDLDGLFAP